MLERSLRHDESCSRFADVWHDPAELRDTNHEARRMARAPVLMTGALVRAPCLTRYLRRGSPQPSGCQHVAEASECGQPQLAPRGVRCTRGPWILWHCHCRGMRSRQRLIWRLRAQLWMAPISRSRVLGPMLPPSAWAWWPFSCVSARLPAMHAQYTRGARGGHAGAWAAALGMR